MVLSRALYPMQGHANVGVMGCDTPLFMKTVSNSLACWHSFGLSLKVGIVIIVCW